jgi:fructose-bisphosphate aldolase, class II
MEEIHEALDHGVVKMNIDTDTQYAFTRPIADHMFTQLRRCAEGRRRGRQQEGLRPALVRQGGEEGMAARVVQACEDLRSAGTKLS